MVKIKFIFVVLLFEFVAMSQTTLFAQNRQKQFTVGQFRYEVLKNDSNSVAVIYYKDKEECFQYISSPVIVPDTVSYMGKTYSITTIMQGTFIGVWKIKSVILPESLTFIGEDVFHHCWLKDIHIPKNVTHIGSGAFSSKFLNSISVDSRNDAYISVDGVLFNKDTTELIAFPSGRKMRTYCVPNTVKKLADKSFRGCDIYDVQLPESLKEIGNFAFNYSKLISIKLPDSLKNIGEGVFSYSYYLKDVQLSRNLREISVGAFEVCKSLTSIVIPEGVKTIGKDAFSGCDSLRVINIPNSVKWIDSSALSNTAWYGNQPRGLVYAGRVLCGYKFAFEDFLVGKTNKKIKNKKIKIHIPEGTVAISLDAFPRYVEITYLSIPSSVERINYTAFSNQYLENIKRIDLWWDEPPELWAFLHFKKKKTSGILNKIYTQTIKQEPLVVIPEKIYQYEIPLGRNFRIEVRN